MAYPELVLGFGGGGGGGGGGGVVGGGGGVVGGGGQKVDHQSPCEVTDSCNPLL